MRYMKLFLLKLGSLAVLTVLVSTAEAQAYRPVASDVTQVRNSTYLLTHTYTAGFLNIDARYPIAATTDYEANSPYPQVGFSVVSSNDNLSAGSEVSALVLSEAAIIDNQYQTLAGTRSTFTLMALVTLPAASGEISDLTLVLQTLPYHYTRNGEEKTGLYKLDTQTADNEILINNSEGRAFGN